MTATPTASGLLRKPDKQKLTNAGCSEAGGTAGCRGIEDQEAPARRVVSTWTRTSTETY